ncbi:hypothetical protein [Streptomyces sp. NPDC093109]|uniref:hypothetical protein n=1 Tax=Streptomyces sp. NPDC093109 TaxID=3154977 RepID=UPI00344B7DDE
MVALPVIRGVTSNSVTVTIAYRVVPGSEAAFHSWAWGVLGESARQPGFLGGGVLVGGEVESHVIYRFGSEASARNWEESAELAHWSDRGVRYAHETGRRSVRDSKMWFDSQSATVAAPRPPPKWKLWFVNMSAVFPPVLLFNLSVLPYLGSLNPLIRTLLLCLAVTAIVTWILMPRLQRFFKKWLYPPLQALRGRHKRRAAPG